MEQRIIISSMLEEDAKMVNDYKRDCTLLTLFIVGSTIPAIDENSSDIEHLLNHFKKGHVDFYKEALLPYTNGYKIPEEVIPSPIYQRFVNYHHCVIWHEIYCEKCWTHITLLGSTVILPFPKHGKGDYDNLKFLEALHDFYFDRGEQKKCRRLKRISKMLLDENGPGL